MVVSQPLSIFLIIMYNKITLIGRLGRDPESKTFESGSVQTTFSIATSESFKDKSGEWQDNTTWHRVVCWGKLAESLAKNLHKGDLVIVEGKQEHRKYTDKDGNDKTISEVVIGFNGAVRKIYVGESNNTTSTSDNAAKYEAKKLPWEEDTPAFMR